MMLFPVFWCEWQACEQQERNALEVRKRRNRKGRLVKGVKINILLVGSPISRGLCTLLNEFFDTKPNHKRDLLKQLR